MGRDTSEFLVVFYLRCEYMKAMARDMGLDGMERNGLDRTEY